MKITKVETDHLRVELKRPVSLPGGQDPRTTTTVDVVLVHLQTETGLRGTGFVTQLTQTGSAVRSVVDSLLTQVLLGLNPLNIESVWLRLASELEAVGAVGLGGRALAAVDFALWDLKGQHCGLPVAQLLGGFRTKLKGIIVDIATPAIGAKLAGKETKHFLELGAAGVQIEIGMVDPELDEERMRALRQVVPDGAWFEVAAGARYDFSTALYMGQLGEESFGIDSYLDPVASQPREHAVRLLDRLTTSIGMGAHVHDVHQAAELLRLPGLSTLRVDPQRLGGFTPARKLAHLAESQQVSVYPVRCPEIGAHLCGGIVYGRMCEYVDWLSGLYTGGPQFHQDQLVVPGGPGLGLQWNESALAQVRVPSHG